MDSSLCPPLEGRSTAGLPEIVAARRDYLGAVLRGARREALRVVDLLLQKGVPVVDIYVDVLQEAMVTVGALWVTGQITVADEHMATIVTQQVLAELYSRVPAPETRRGTVVITGVVGELHQLGAHMVADVLDAQGWSVQFLGTSLPQGAILSAVDSAAPDVLGISATMTSSLPAVRALIAAVREKKRERAPFILVGGCAFRGRPELVAEVGASAHGGDLRSTLALMNTPGGSSTL